MSTGSPNPNASPLSAILGTETVPETEKEILAAKVGEGFKICLEEVAKEKSYLVQNVPELVLGLAVVKFLEKIGVENFP